MFRVPYSLLISSYLKMFLCHFLLQTRALIGLLEKLVSFPFRFCFSKMFFFLCLIFYFFSLHLMFSYFNATFFLSFHLCEFKIKRVKLKRIKMSKNIKIKRKRLEKQQKWKLEREKKVMLGVSASKIKVQNHIQNFAY